MAKRLKIKRGKVWRKEQIALIADLIRSYKTVGIAKVRGIGARQLQRLSLIHISEPTRPY